MSFEIMTDDTANLSQKIKDKYNITAIPFPYYVNDKECHCSDVEAFDDQEYYGLMGKGVHITTSQINPQRYIEYMEPILSNGNDILFVGLSSGISGSFASARIAKDELTDKYPERNICLVDSLGAGLGEGMVVLKAAQLKEKGLSLSETEEQLLKYIPRIYQVFIADDLMHLRRTGRLSNVSAVVGSVLGIRPLLKGSSEGKIVAFNKIRGKKSVIKAMAEKYFSLVKNTDLIAITYTGVKENAEYLINLINEKMPPKSIWLEKHEPATGSHLGPGSLALFFEGDDLVREK